MRNGKLWGVVIECILAICGPVRQREMTTGQRETNNSLVHSARSLEY
jgi:hypothetical protein